MLTPEYLEDIEFNKVVELYNQLNIDITRDIIDKMQDTDLMITKEQIKVLVRTNGKEIFKKALNKTANLSPQVKKELIKLYEDMAKQDLEGYKELFEYRGKKFKLSDSQAQILKQGIKQTNKTLKNFTKTIAFSGQQSYVEAVDRAYLQVASGGVDYITAIDNTCKDLAEKGITLKDKAGRDTKIEVAVRRNVLGGIQTTANEMNRDLEKQLGCNGYEVTAHSGARPTHAEAQGKQYALTKADAQKYGLDLWNDVEDLWNEPNCRHTYFGIILGISQPQYSDDELSGFENATVTYNGEEMPEYEATQKQRSIERKIRNTKRTIESLKNTNTDITQYNTKLRKYKKEYNDFAKQTGLSKQDERTKVY